ncbi:uncharacterized protein LOC123221624 [Mangifera indica]|uniref:uncharacterized protein LOC123221624 n=1 Tax=Mangifera indica TaxID=29780 RepID=UPI001CFC351A|nr:uncharacterized protein LOC123221624 [Mangifera indica]
MSESDKEISRVGSTVDDDDYDGDDDDQTVEGGGGGVHGNEGEENHGGFSWTQKFRRRVKKVVLFPVAKAKKQLYKRRQRLQNKRAPLSDDFADAERSNFCVLYWFQLILETGFWRTFRKFSYYWSNTLWTIMWHLPLFLEVLTPKQ